MRLRLCVELTSQKPLDFSITFRSLSVSISFAIIVSFSLLVDSFVVTGDCVLVFALVLFGWRLFREETLLVTLELALLLLLVVKVVVLVLGVAMIDGEPIEGEAVVAVAEFDAATAAEDDV